MTTSADSLVHPNDTAGSDAESRTDPLASEEDGDRHNPAAAKLDDEFDDDAPAIPAPVDAEAEETGRLEIVGGVEHDASAHVEGVEVDEQSDEEEHTLSAGKTHTSQDVVHVREQ